jgi:hypothetical protein
MNLPTDLHLPACTVYSGRSEAGPGRETSIRQIEARLSVYRDLDLPRGTCYELHVVRGSSTELDYRLKPGTYWLAAHLAGFGADNRRTFTVANIDRVKTALPDAARSVRTFDMVNPESNLGPPPLSNALQFEVPNG